MIDNIARKLNSHLSFWCKKNKSINNNKDILIRKYIQTNLLRNEIIKKNLKETHNLFNKRLYLLLKKENIKNFLRVGFIQKMFFLHNRFFVYLELRVLKNEIDWPFYKKLLDEDDIGNPIRYFLYQNSSGNRINHVYHLSVLSKELNINLHKIKRVFEFGGGYGCMARIFSKLNKQIKYLCFDTHYVNLLQYYYLKHNNLDVGFSKKNKYTLFSKIQNLRKINNKFDTNLKSLFIANWSLSETPIKFRENFIEIIKKNEFILICFQEKFEDIDNLKYFDKLKSKLSKSYKIKILKNKFYTGNMINRHNHYFFIGKKVKN
jgi:putative sugar O-methyltransferase|tara:strand:+ start:1294 stop:2250 length:957 start_codon:yes stop_codon:yes gene_type:complete